MLPQKLSPFHVPPTTLSVENLESQDLKNTIFLPPFVICAASQVETGNVQGRDKVYTWVLDVAPAEIDFGQVEITNTIARDFLDFLEDCAKMIGMD